MMRRSHTTGFTLIELLTAIGISTLLIVLIGVIFGELAKVTRRGVALSKVVADGRTVVDRIRNDSQYMLGPDATAGSAAGFIVILNHLDTDNVRREIDGVSGTVVETTSRAVLSDQLTFIYNNATPQATAFAPKAKNSSVNNTIAPYLRVWYGHLHRTEENGVDAYIDSLTAESSVPVGEIAGVDFASQRMLGRQALHLVEDAEEPSTIHATSASIYGPVTGYASAGPNGHPETLATAGGTGLHTYMAITDVADRPLTDTILVGGGVLENLLSAVSPTTYGDIAVSQYIYSGKRLRANILPLYDTTAGSSPYEYVYASWQIAQMQPVLAENISDFIVEFAGDYLPSGAPDGDVDLDNSGNIKWYGFWYNDPDTNTRRDSSSPFGAALTHDSDEPDVYFPPIAVAGGFNDATNANTPEYFDNSGSYAYPIVAPTIFTDAAFVFRHDDDLTYTDSTNFGSRWPTMLRIRFRVHDERGYLVDANQEPGKWFQVILTVPRP